MFRRPFLSSAPSWLLVPPSSELIAARSARWLSTRRGGIVIVAPEQSILSHIRDAYPAVMFDSETGEVVTPNALVESGTEDGLGSTTSPNYQTGRRNFRKDRSPSAPGFVDRLRVRVQAGAGGAGATSFKRGPNAVMVPPDGGNGGNGGSVWLKADISITSLSTSRRMLRAEDGRPGMSGLRQGRNGEDVTLLVPPGTTAQIADTDWENQAGLQAAVGLPLVCDLDEHGSLAQVAKGGTGGRGNASFKSSRNRSPETSQPGMPGEFLTLDLEVKSIADVGLVGLPNAGKSTLLRAMSRATPKVASYPFTTMRPHIGIAEHRRGTNDLAPRRISVADIPGLVEGAHENRGLGHEFLRHIERTSMLVYVLDLSAQSDCRHVLDVLLRELEMYEPGLAMRRSCVAANKMDTGMAAVENLRALIASLGDSVPVFPISAQCGTGTADLVEFLVDSVHAGREAQRESVSGRQPEDVRSDVSQHTVQASA